MLGGSLTRCVEENGMAAAYEKIEFKANNEMRHGNLGMGRKIMGIDLRNKYGK